MSAAKNVDPCSIFAPTTKQDPAHLIDALYEGTAFLRAVIDAMEVVSEQDGGVLVKTPASLAYLGQRLVDLIDDKVDALHVAMGGRTP